MSPPQRHAGRTGRPPDVGGRPGRATATTGRAAPVGRATRGTTNTNRLRRVDSWICAVLGPRLPDDPLVVDLGYGSWPVTTLELRARLARVRPSVRVVGLEIDPARVAEATRYHDPPGLTFALGGFELAGLRPALVRSMNVLRQYPESEVDAAWSTMSASLAPGGYALDGTCDELGRLASWILLDASGPRSLTLSLRLSTMDTPGQVAERLPKALIHHNVPGHWVHRYLGALDRAWRAAAPLSAFGYRQRWIGAVSTLRAAGWPVRDGARRWRLGEVTIDWPAADAMAEPPTADRSGHADRVGPIGWVARTAGPDDQKTLPELFGNAQKAGSIEEPACLDCLP